MREQKLYFLPNEYMRRFLMTSWLQHRAKIEIVNQYYIIRLKFISRLCKDEKAFHRYRIEPCHSKDLCPCVEQMFDQVYVAA